MTTRNTARWTTNLDARVGMSSTRLPNDCGIIALAVLASAVTGKRGDYDACARLMTERGIYDPATGSKTGKTAELIRWITGNKHRRLTPQYKGNTLDKYLAARPGWTGLAIVRMFDGDKHAVPVVNGVAYNTGGGSCMTTDLIATLAV